MEVGKAHQEETSSQVSTLQGSAGNGVAVLLGTLFFVYVGTEVGTSSWSPAHAQSAASWSSNNWTLTPMFFFAGLLGGRGASAAILLHLKEATVAVSGLLIAAAGELFFFTAPSPATLFSRALFAGLGPSRLHPVSVASP